MRPSRPLSVVAASAVLAAVLTSCASQEDPETAPEPAATASSSAPADEPTEPEASEPPAESEGVVVEITVTGDDVSPNGESVEVGAGDPVQLRIEADRAGELHVHGTPESYVDFTEGTTTAELTFDRPGVVEVEEHDTGKVIVQFEVR